MFIYNRPTTMAMNGHYYHYQRNEHRLEMQMCLDSSMLIFCIFFFFFTPLNNYLQTDYMYGMATRMTTVNDHPVKDDEWGTRDADDASQVPGMFFFLYLFLFY